MKRAGIFGPSESGKSTLAQHLSREYWRACGIPSLVLDPHLDTWGPQAWVTSDESQFWPVVWRKQHCLVIVEEAAATIRRARDLVPVFTAIRHQFHKLLVIGHDGTDLLPVMRRQFQTIYLFLQPPEAVALWTAALPAHRGLEQAANLNQYEFLRCQPFQTAKKMRLQI